MDISISYLQFLIDAEARAQLLYEAAVARGTELDGLSRQNDEERKLRCGEMEHARDSMNSYIRKIIRAKMDEAKDNEK